MRHGVRLGVDVGQARIGLARCDSAGMFASAVETVPRSAEGEHADIDRLLAIAAEADAIEWIVGLPLSMTGGTTASTEDALGFAERLARASELPVRLLDERLSTVSAHAQLRASGKKTRTHRPVVDQVAAVILLQHALDAERAGQIIGRLLDRPAD